MYALDHQELFQNFLGNLPAPVAMLDCQMRYLAVSRRWLSAHHLEEQNLLGCFHSEIFPQLPLNWKEKFTKALTGIPQTCENWQMQPWQQLDGQIGGIMLLSTDLNNNQSKTVLNTPKYQHKPSRFLNKRYNNQPKRRPRIESIPNASSAKSLGETKVLEMIATGTAVPDILHAISNMIEAQFQPMRCSILLLDAGGKNLHRGAAPNLPEAYNQAIEGMPIGPSVGSCGTAAYFGKSVIVSDIATDPLWANYRDFALSFGLRSCWSFPIFSITGKVLGTFGIYDTKPHTPTEQQIRVLETAAHLAGIAIDRDRRERELHASEQRYQRLSANIPGMLYQYRLQKNGTNSFTYVSAGCRELFEMEPEVFLKITPQELTHPDDLTGLMESISESAQNLQDWKWEGRLFTATGKIKWVRAASRPELYPNGDIVWDGLLTEISDQKLAEFALRKSEANLAEAQKLAHVGSWEFDAITQQLTWSDELYRIYGFSLGEINPSFEEVLRRVHPDDLPMWQTTVTEAMNAGKCAEFEHRIIRPDNSVRHLYVIGQTAFNQQNQVIKVFATCLDITERKNIEAALRQYQEHLEELVQTRTAALEAANQQLCQEIVERVQAEQALKDSEEQLRLAINAARMGLWKWDKKTNTTHYFHGIESLFGVDADQLNNLENFISCVHPEDRQLVIDVMEIAIAQQVEYSVDYRIVWPDSSIHWISCQAGILRNENGAFVGMAGTVMDVTERKGAELALQRSEHQFRALYEATSLAVLIGNENGFFDGNSAAVELYGCQNRQQFSGLHPAHLSPPYQPNGQDSFSTVNQFIAQAFEKGNHRFEWIHRRFDGSEFPAEVWLTALELQEGELFFQAVVQDLTERKQAEIAIRESEAKEREKAQQLQLTVQELKRTQAQLIQSEKMSSLGQLVAGVAHEINNPVNFIYGNLVYASQYVEQLLYLLHLYKRHYPEPPVPILAALELAEIDFLVEDLPKIMESMKIGAERIREIVLSLRNFSRLDQSDRKLADIHSGIDSALMILQHRLVAQRSADSLTQKRPRIKVIKDYADLPLVDCFPGAMNQVFMNILSNAIDAFEDYYREVKEEENTSPWVPTISIKTEQISPQRLAIKIIDNGIGMNEAVKNKLFDPFFTTKPVGKGTGLGLSISYQIVVEKHGGSLSCSSQRGVGTEFIIEIPFKR
ncbi:PAS domain-containing protein [Ancylothrix sp. C2]|uniref:PAS domain-containing protein n=1 Tax=Ancylothrix sp. D3o TaxID=2953691 RepID=UPI0021BA9FC0|nr:PAS domain-containing protein [Ancylothrix sp. D3o]MCT7949037.1 PAS domain-containing protein [Ancylothrix sp. D3o]